MKKRITWLWTVLLVSLSLQAAQVLYVYRSDSVIDAFFTSEIDSIRYSQYDMDSVWHDSCQVQEIWTADSIYRVPLYRAGNDSDRGTVSCYAVFSAGH